LIILGALVFLWVFVLISYADLESDYINPIDLVSRVNQFTVPEYAVHAFLTLLFLISGCWFEFLWNAPIVGWHINNVLQKSMYLDATSIFARLGQEKKKGYIKLGFYMLSFFFYLYRLIYTLVKEILATPSVNPVY